MRLIDGKLLADEILGEIFERGQASGLWEKQLEIGALTYADIEFGKGYDSALDDVYRQISDMKTVDAMPVIRCKDCKFSSPNGVYGCRIKSFADDIDKRLYSDDFCSRAERKEE